MPAKPFVALLRGINVGRANRIAMADLTTMMERLGFEKVRTLLASGNLVFTVPGNIRTRPGKRIESALAQEFGVQTRVIVLSAPELSQIIDENPLGETATDPSRLLVAVFANPADIKLLEPMQKRRWGSEQLAVGQRAAYLWCPNGVLASPLAEALLGKAFREVVTSRNWSTLLKLQAMVVETTQH